MPQEPQNREPVVVERVQTGVRMEKRLLKVLKAVAELKEMTLGDLLEGIVLHAFEGKLVPFSPQTLKEIEQFKSIYGMTLKASRQPQPEGAATCAGADAFGKEAGGKRLKK